MRILKLILVLIIFNVCTVVLADSMSDAFNKREQFKNGTVLGDPDKIFIDNDSDVNKNAEFFKKAKDADVSAFQQLNDASLVDQGQSELRSSEYGKFLQNSEESKIEAINRYKINSENPMLKRSLAIEKDPMSETGGKGLSATETTASTEVKKSCTEGIDFNVDVGLELVLEVEEEEYLGPPMLKTIDIPYSEIPSHWWQEQRYTSPTYHGRRGHGVDFGYHVISNSQHIINDIQAEINKRITEPAIVTVPNQDIVFIRIVNTKVPNRNVTFSGPPQKLVCFQRYTGDALVKFHYNSQEKLKKLVEKAEYWQVATEGTEKLAESNECYETGRVCLKSGVKTFLGKYDISRPCWYEKITYHCQSEPRDGCAHLIKQNCRLEDSTCEYKIGSLCLKWKRDFVCGGVKKERHYSLADSPIYCLGGDCHTPTTEDNKDFANVAYLAALNEASKDCVKEPSGLCKDPITVFPGQVDGCKKIIVGVIDCCSSMKGWAKNANLCRCSGGEQGLALKRDKKLCHRVGTYCHERDPVFKKCLVKKTNYCCFGSKLARIFQEQARKQLPIGWGSEKSPDCRPLTLKELTQLDFSKFDFEELFEGLLSKGKNNMNKSFPNLNPGEIPDIQKDHMKTTAGEKRDIKRRDEEESERIRLAKIEAERLEQEQLQEIARKKDKIRIEQQNIQNQIAQKEQALVKAKDGYKAATLYWNNTGHKVYSSKHPGYQREWDKVQVWSDKCTQLDSDVRTLKYKLTRLR